MYRELSICNLQGEIWKSINENYMISNFGRVKSVFKKRTDKCGRIYKHKPKILKQHLTTTGYLKVTLMQLRNCKVHRLVAMAFIDNPLNKPIINHKDLNPLNNMVDNLEWCTQMENVNHALKNGARKNLKLYDTEKAKDLYKQGFKAGYISHIVNAPKTTIYKLMEKSNISRRDYKQLSKIDIELIKTLFSQGKDNRFIYNNYNVSPNYVARRRYQFNKGEI